MSEYTVVIAPLKDEDGGGYIGMVPDLVGCMSDGNTHQEALANTLAAIDEWIDEAHRRSIEIPAPGTAARLYAKKQKALKETVAKIIDVEDRLQNLEVSIKDLNEQADNIESWVRFSSIAGLEHISEQDDRPPLPC